MSERSSELQASKNRWRDHIPFLLGALLFLGVTIAAVITITNRTDGKLVYSLDDTYIHMAIAKNLVRHGIWGVTGFHFASASSSLLWTILLGAVYLISGVNTWAPLALNILISLAIMLTADIWWRRFQADGWARLSGILGLLMVIPMVTLPLISMEHGLHLILTIAFAASATRELTQNEPPRGSGFMLPLLASLLALSRYEGLFLIGVTALLFILRRRVLRGLLIAVISVIPLIVFGLLSLHYGGGLVPNPVLLKATGGSRFSILGIIFKPVGVRDWIALVHNPALTILALTGIILFILAIRKGKTLWHPNAILPMMLTLMILMHLHYGFSYSFWVFRYTSYLFAFAVFVFVAIIANFFSYRGRPSEQKNKYKLTQRTVFLLSIMVMAAFLGPVAVHPWAEIDEAEDNYLEHCSMAMFISRYYPNDAVVVNDIGAVCFYTDTEILDLFGLGSLEPIAIRRSGRSYDLQAAEEWTRNRGGKIAILQVDWSEITPLISPRWIPVAEMIVPGSGKKVRFYALNKREQASLRFYFKDFFSTWAESHGINGYLIPETNN